MEKNYVIFVNESCILLISWIFLDLDFKFIKRFGLKLDLDLVLKIQDWIWKYDSPASIRISSDVLFPVVRLDFVFTEKKTLLVVCLTCI